MAAFSRLQLAAALLEYDNDNPNLPHRSAHESAIFAPLRRNTRPYAVSRGSDHLGVSLPSETGSVGGRESVLDGRKSRSSIGPLKNMFAGDAMEGDIEEEEEEEDAPDVDLTSWGLDAFMSKEKETRNTKGKAKSLPSGQALQNVPSFLPQTDANGGVGVIRRPKNGRSLSVGNYDFLTPMDNTRRQSIGSPLDLAGLEVPTAFQRPSPTVYDDPIPVGLIPFPTRSIRSPSPEAGPSRLRTYSSGSLEPNRVLNENRRSRLLSTGTMDTTRMLDEDDNPFALRPPSRSSKFDPKAAVHARTMSNASLGSRMLLENDAVSVMTMNKRPSNMDLLRPKVLVMPSPLQSAGPPLPAPKGRDGFKVSADPPLPPGARSSRPPIASNSFTPNSSRDLSLSQMTFRNHLMVDGQRDISFNDGLPRALEEGEQIKLEDEEVPVAYEPVAIPVDDDSRAAGRPAGKLYGKSLIDDLENRKSQMKGKQRVFTGDDRPSMMKRGTLIDPESLRRPVSQTIGPGLSRRGSLNSQPLLKFDDEHGPHSSQQPVPQVRSVFGVDTLWEREMAKLKVIEAQEAAERERREREEAAKSKKNRKKGKKGTEHLGNDGEGSSPQHLPVQAVTLNGGRGDDFPKVSDVAPVLPDIPTSRSAGRSALSANAPVIRGPPPVIDDNGSDSEESIRESRKPTKTEGWHSSEEEDGDDSRRRTTGVGLRYPNSKADLNRPLPANELRRDDSDEDIPLSMTMQRSTLRTTQQFQEDESDEDKPLSIFLDKTRLNLPPVNFDGPKKSQDDGDDEPLGLRTSRMIPSSHGHDDDVPLAFHPQQQFKSQHQMLQQQQMMQQQQQQMMMQNNMFFTPSMSGFFPPMMPSMLQVPIPMPSPPPVQDTSKLNRVDRWRHDVAIES
ncbi:hypothetical protein E1B28_004374 [Marasmius oreades]|uniref:Uncharacterized protein n=1 Tax=Marasmius oreades TaxID=181124 RepID=A0A9P7UYL8_9AGAR|nr:uncharacterized protein E1B28_004374 [Marasmius oreades]KAG7096978.1 hypothetical protein E1B28_004374 [Marasmius oreades]